MNRLLISLGLAVISMNFVRGNNLDTNNTPENPINKQIAGNALKLADFIRRVNLPSPFNTGKNKSDEEDVMSKQQLTTEGLIFPVLTAALQVIVTGINGMNTLLNNTISVVSNLVTALMGSSGMSSLQLISPILSSITTPAGSSQTTSSNGPASNLQSLNLSQILNGLFTNGLPTSETTGSPISPAVLTNVFSQLLTAVGTAPVSGSTSADASGSASGSATT